jgi:branched-chain amino acid transport system ATP-binding protein
VISSAVPEGSPAPNMLDVRDLAVAYGRAEAVRGVTFRVPRGEIVALLGPNGAGKSSTLTAIAGLTKAQGGEVLLDGFPITRAPGHVLVRRGLVYVPQGRAILATLSVEDNLLLGAYWRRNDRELTTDIDGMYRRFPILADHRRAAAGTLTAGEQQLLALARGLLARPRLLLLDEPSLGLAPAWERQLFELIADLRRNGLTVLLAEQNARRALAIAQHAVILEAGRLVLAGSAEELAADPRVRAAYLGRRVGSA